MLEKLFLLILTVLVILLMGCVAAKIKPDLIKVADLPKTSRVKTVTLFDIYLVRKIFDASDLAKIISMDEENPVYCITADGPYSIDDNNVLHVKNIRVICYTSASVFGNKNNPNENMLSPIFAEIKEARIKLDQRWLSCIVLEKNFIYTENNKQEQIEYYVTVYGREKAYILKYKTLLLRTKIEE